MSWRSPATAVPTTEPRDIAPPVEHVLTLLGVELRRGTVRLGGATVELWCGTFPEHAPSAEVMAVLSAEERERAGRLRIAERATAAVWSRALLRSVLAQYLDCAPAALQLEIGARGKPSCAAGLDWAPQFNVSHSAGAFLVAVCATHAVGVDLERLRPVRHVDALVARALSRIDRARFEEQRATGQPDHDAFLRVWTMVEARAKALGTGVETHGAAGMPELETLPCARLVGGLLAPGHVGAVAAVT